MAETVTIDGLTIDKGLYDFITDDAMPGTGVEADGFWPAFAAIVHDLAPVNRALLQKRGALQQKIDGFYKAKGGTDYSMNEYKAYLEEIGYLVPKATISPSRPKMSMRKSRKSPGRSSSCRS
jgi:malate synthase